MILDIHVHVSALTAAHGLMSPRLLSSTPFRFMQWRLGIAGNDEPTERKIEALMVRTIAETTRLDAAVVLAFDAVHDRDGNLDLPNTHLYVTNDYVIELARKHKQVLFAASVHPYRKDAVAELERCVKAGAVLMKWLPIVQNFNPADPKCEPFYEALAHYKLPLLSHTGGEKTLPNLDSSVADPRLLLPALKRGVKVIMAHCGTRSAPSEPDFLPQFMRLAREHEHCYGDTAALNLPTRSYAFGPILKDEQVRSKLVHGSDWPVISLPPFTKLPLHWSIEALRDRNWMRRDITLKERLGFDEAYWQRAAKVLNLVGRR